MDSILVKGGAELHGQIPIAGAKNACLALMPAALLSDEPLTLTNAPRLSDIRTMTQLLQSLGAEASQLQGGQVIALSGHDINNLTADYEIVRKMRASNLVLGPLLARFGPRGRVAAGRLCDWGAPDGYSYRGAGGAGREDRPARRLSACGCAQGAEGGDLQDAFRLCGCDREPGDGGDFGQGHDRSAKRRARAGDRRPGEVPARDGGRDRGRGLPRRSPFRAWIGCTGRPMRW